MLQTIREKTSGWIAYVIIGLISIPFALWGINSYFGGGEAQPAAVVNGETISVSKLDFAYARYRERLASMFGGQIPEAFANDDMLKQQALNQLIQEQVVLNYVENKSFRVGDQQLYQQIKSMPVFQQDGAFNAQLYQDQLRSQGYSPELFEHEVRIASQMDQLNRGINETAFVLPYETKRYQALQNQQRYIRTLTFSASSEKVEVTDSEVEAYYLEQTSQFMVPEQVKVNYIEVTLDTVKNDIEVSEDEILDRYEQQKDQLLNKETRTASHILLTANDDDEQQVETTIKELKQRIDQGEDFAELARQYSQDPGSASSGGELGEVERGMMVQPFEDALFELDEGSVSQPVKTQFGWHLIKLDHIQAAKVPELDEVRATLIDEIKLERAEERIYDFSEQMATIGYEQPDSLEPVAEALGLTVQQSPWFSRDKGEGVASEAKFRQSAFSEPVKFQNQNSDVIELSPNHLVMIHLESVQSSKPKPLESVRDEIADMLKTRKLREMVMQSGKAAMQALQDGKQLEEVSEDHGGLEIKEFGLVKRDNDQVNNDILSTAFKMSKPLDSKAVYEGISEPSGDYTIIELSQIEMPEVTDDPSTKMDSLKSSRANYDYQAFIKVLIDEAEVSTTPLSELK